MTESTPSHRRGAEHPAPALRRPRIDLTLSPRRDADGRALAPPAPFPDLGRGARLVLYPVRTGLAVDWDLADLDPQAARDSFPDYLPAPQAAIRLCRIGDGGRVEVAAQTELSDLSPDADPRGRHRFDQPDGQAGFQAEFGLTTPGGGWVLLLRSNRIALGADQPPDLRPSADRAGGALSPASVADAAPAAADPSRPSPEVLSPVDLNRPEAAPVPTPTATPTTSTTAPAGPAARPATQDDPSRIHAVRYLADGRILIGSGPDSSPPVAADPIQSAQLRHGAESAQPAPAPPPGPDADRHPAADPTANATPDHRPDDIPTPGSGPITDLRDADGIGLTAELIVTGHAPPGTLLDLGGHPYRVGPGGRFKLHMPIPEHERIQALLRQLPRLPVDVRD